MGILPNMGLARELVSAQKIRARISYNHNIITLNRRLRIFPDGGISCNTTENLAKGL